jgi:hypothetical protein
MAGPVITNRLPPNFKLGWKTTARSPEVFMAVGA